MISEEQFTELAEMHTSIFTIASPSNTKDLHSHKVGQLSVPQNGTMYLIVAEQLYIVPPHVAIFIPKNIKHRIYKISQHTIIDNIYFKDEYARLLPQRVITINLSELAKVLITKLCQTPKNQLETTKTTQIISVLISELNEAINLNTYVVKTPHTDKLIKVFNYLLGSIDYFPSLADCAREISVSPRTLQRMITYELNLNFIMWRQQIMFAKSLELLHLHHKTSIVAYKLGYNSESAFISMFKKLSGGKLPSQFNQKFWANDTAKKD